MDKNIVIYLLANEYLESIKPEGVNLEKYYHSDAKDYSTLKDIYLQFISSAQNYQSMPNVIQFNKRQNKIAELLYDFDYARIKDLSHDLLYRSFRQTFGITSADTKYNSWYKWSKSVIDSSKFISDFRDVGDFVRFVELFNYNVSTRMALPLLISQKISGIGFALACDLLKELGFTDYPKPDVHLKEVFSALGLAEKNNLSTFEAIVRMSESCKAVDESVTPYKVDKIFWLICSGRFYHDTTEEKLTRHKNDFIKKALKKLELPEIENK